MAFNDIIALFAMFSSLLFYFIPYNELFKLIKYKDNSKMTSALYIITIINCEFWFIYGLKKDNWNIWFGNSIGIINNFIFITFFLLYEKSYKICIRLILISTIYILFSISSIYFFLTLHNLDTLGLTCIVMNSLMYSAPMQNIKKVFKRKDPSFIPIGIVICLMFNTLLWTWTAINKQDLFLFIPSCLGLFLSIFQIIVYLKYRKYAVDDKELIDNAELYEKYSVSLYDKNIDRDKKKDKDKERDIEGSNIKKKDRNRSKEYSSNSNNKKNKFINKIQDKFSNLRNKADNSNSNRLNSNNNSFNSSKELRYDNLID